jgi:hypothetical protein
VLWLAVCYVAARGDDTVYAITVEDLSEALERGDITADEFDVLYELVYSRSVADSAELARASEALVPLVSRARALAVHTSTPAHGYLRYSYFSPLRGSGSPRQYITANPEFGSVTADLRLSRHSRSLWQVDEVAAHFASRLLSMTAGVLTPRWTGGLLIGRAPMFLDHSGAGWRGLWLPSRARLYGVQAALKHRLGEVAVLQSSLSDSVYTHKVRGLRTLFRFGPVILEPAVVIQRVDLSGGASAFAGRFWGFAGAGTWPAGALEIDLATDERVMALQARAHGRSGQRRWWLEYWHIPQGYRNPLLHGRGESDREMVAYPELDAVLSSASTGERGGRFDVRFGGTGSYIRLQMAAWREAISRQASVRVRATAGNTLARHAFKWDYLLYSRVSDGLRSQRHEAQLKVSRNHVFVSARVRVTEGTPSTFGPIGGQLVGGISFPPSLMGAWSLHLAAESFDLGSPAKQFVTVRVAQQLPFRYGRMDMHLRWRSTYASQPSVLSLRIDSRVYL